MCQRRECEMQIFRMQGGLRVSVASLEYDMGLASDDGRAGMSGFRIRGLETRDSCEEDTLMIRTKER